MRPKIELVMSVVGAAKLGVLVRLVAWARTSSFTRSVTGTRFNRRIEFEVSVGVESRHGMAPLFVAQGLLGVDCGSASRRKHNRRGQQDQDRGGCEREGRRVG